MDRELRRSFRVWPRALSFTEPRLVRARLRRADPRAGARLAAHGPRRVDAAAFRSSVFLHERGAFTGALQSKQGLELAVGGTVFLDEIGELPAATQVKLLRLLQEHTLQRVGANETRHVDFRVIAVTNREPASELRNGALSRGLLLPPRRGAPRGPSVEGWPDRLGTGYGPADRRGPAFSQTGLSDPSGRVLGRGGLMDLAPSPHEHFFYRVQMERPGRRTQRQRVLSVLP